MSFSSVGYDLGIYGAALPLLLEDKSWALSPAEAGTIIVGILMTLQYDQVWNFYLFAIAGLIAAIAIFFIPQQSKAS